MSKKLAIIILLILIALTSLGFWFLIKNRKVSKEVPVASSPYVKDGKIIDPVARKAELEVLVEKEIVKNRESIAKTPKKQPYSDSQLQAMTNNRKQAIKQLVQKKQISAEDENLLK